MDPKLVKRSKFLSRVLRHQPERIGITLDAEGWVSIDELLAAAQAANVKLSRELLLRVVDENDKQRFAISPDGQRIRASQGHSVPVDLALPPTRPPAVLYHGTVERYVDSIRAHGLVPGTRRHVHLSADRETAETVGRRRGQPIVLEVDAAALAELTEFYLSDNGVWLTEHVPVEYLRFP